MNTPGAGIKDRWALLSDIASDLRRLEEEGAQRWGAQRRLGNLEVAFFKKNRKRPTKVMSLVSALWCLAEDIYWDETADWSACSRAEVREL